MEGVIGAASSVVASVLGQEPRAEFRVDGREQYRGEVDLLEAQGPRTFCYRTATARVMFCF